MVDVLYFVSGLAFFMLRLVFIINKDNHSAGQQPGETTQDERINGLAVEKTFCDKAQYCSCQYLGDHDKEVEDPHVNTQLVSGDRKSTRLNSSHYS